MATVYEVYYYKQVGVSDPLKDKDDVKITLATEGVFGLSDDDVEPGKSFWNNEGNLIMISAFDDGDE